MDAASGAEGDSRGVQLAAPLEDPRRVRVKPRARLRIAPGVWGSRSANGGEENVGASQREATANSGRHTEEPVACPDPVFVLGCPRSGTSVLAWSLAQHPDMWTSVETDFLLYLFGPPLSDFYGRSKVDRALERITTRPGGSWLDQHGIARAEFIAHIGLGLNALITKQAPGKRWVDQSPGYTVMASTLAELFPMAYFVHVLRDGRRVVHSMINSGFDVWWATDFRQACRVWANFVESAMEFQRSVPERCMTVRLEELSVSPRRSFANILQFIKAPLDDAPADFFASNRINSSYEPKSQRGGARGLAGTAAASSARGTRLTEPWLLWSPEERAIFVEEAGASLVKHGYATPEELVP